MVFPVVMYGCESWTVEKAEHRRTDAFELWCCRRLLRVPWTARRFSQSILRRPVLGVHWKDWCWNSNTLATWCEELMYWKRLMLGGIGGRRRRGRQRMRWLDGITDSMDICLGKSGIWWWTWRPGVLRFMGSQRVGHNWATELNWMSIQVWFPLGLTGLISLLSKRFSRVFSSITVQEYRFFGTKSSL